MKFDYDSQEKKSIFYETFVALWSHRLLIELLVKNELSMRYKRSILGLFWTLLNPLLTSLVLWFVFVTIFVARLPDGTEFAPFVLSGVILVTFFVQGFNLVADSIAKGTSILTKIHVPPQVFAVSSAITSAVNFFAGLIALAFVSIVTGDGISYKAPLTLFIVLLMLIYITGLGMIVSLLYIRFDDTRNIIAILVSFMMYLSPVFYPKEILSTNIRFIVNLNPLTSYLDIFRSVFSNTGVATLFDWIFVVITSLTVFLFGIRIFVKLWPKTIVMLS